MTDLVIGLDIGTSATKAIAVDDTGVVRASAIAGYATVRAADGVAEQDAEHWWDAAAQTVRTITDHLGAQKRHIRALSVSAQGGATVLVDGQGSPLAPVRSWLDTRPREAAERLRLRFGSHGFYERTGWRLGPRYNAAQILHLRRHEAELFARTAFFLDTASFIAMRLTGSPVLDVNSAGITQLTNATATSYDPEIVDAIGVTNARLPELVASGTMLGPLTGQAAAHLGLSPDVTVIAGGHDQYCAAVGAGAIDASTLLLSAGTAWVVLGAASTPIPDPQENFAFGSHIVPGLWGQFGSLLNGGSSLEWVRSLWSTTSGPLDLEQVGADAAATRAGADGLRFLPHFGGTVPEWNEASKGSFVGMDLSHERRHVMRAALEGIAAEAAVLIGLHRDLNPQPDRIRLIGGASRSPVWTQIIADMVAMPVDVPRSVDAASFGAAVIAAAGEPSAIAATSRAMVGDSTEIDPGPDAEIYAADAPSRQVLARTLSEAYRTIDPDRTRRHRGHS